MDDMALIADSEKLKKTLDEVVNESDSNRLSINYKKTEYLMLSKQKIGPDCNITVKNESNKLISLNILAV